MLSDVESIYDFVHPQKSSFWTRLQQSVTSLFLKLKKKPDNVSFFFFKEGIILSKAE